jgi:hypothetical protein
VVSMCMQKELAAEQPCTSSDVSRQRDASMSLNWQLISLSFALCCLLFFQWSVVHLLPQLECAADLRRQATGQMERSKLS